MDFAYISMILSLWLFLSGVVFVSGAFAVRIFVTGPSGADVCMPAGKNRCFGESAARSIFLVSLLTLLINAVHFTLHGAIMTDTPLREVFSILPAFLTKTRYGELTILRTLFLLVVTLIAFMSVTGDRKYLTLSGAVFSLFLIVAISMSGHQGVKGYATIPFYLDVLHISAVSLWIGGIFFLSRCFSFLMKDSGAELFEIFRSLINRFSLLATICVIVAGITGVLLAFFNVRSLSVLTHTQYGGVLLLKTVLVGFIAILGGVNKFFVIPALNISGRDRWPELQRNRKKLFVIVKTEMCLGAVVLLLTSFLTHLSPEG